ncbi:MAG: AMIN domain-containing protein, partial [Geobacteraceae bacterium]
MIYRKFLIVMTLIFFAAGLPQSAYSVESGAGKKGVKKGADAKNVREGKKPKDHTSAKGKARKGTAPTARSVAAVAPPPKAAESPALVKEMRYWSNPDYTRVAVTLDREVKFEPNHLPANRETDTTSRLYIDLSDARIAPGIKDIPIGDGLLKTARIAQYRPDIVRVVLDMESIKDYKIFTFSDPFRIIIDVKGGQRAEFSRLPETSIAPMPPPVPATSTQQTEEKPKSSARPAIAKVRRIVVDPGHGGHDPG